MPPKGGWKRRIVIGAIATDAGGEHPHLLLTTRKGAVNAPDILAWLAALRRYARKRGKKVVLVWDGLAAHKARVVPDRTGAEASWLEVRRFPAYAPERNPQEVVWASMKTKDFAGRLFDFLADIDATNKKAGRRLRRRPDILRGCLKATGLWWMAGMGRVSSNTGRIPANALISNGLVCRGREEAFQSRVTVG